MLKEIRQLVTIKEMMYWDGLILEEQEPDQAILLVEDYDDKIQDMINEVNKFNPIKDGVKKYNFKAVRFSEVNLNRDTKVQKGKQ